MEKRNLTCIRCPLGCQITVTLENGEVTEVTGNTCPRGEQYAKKEVTNPTRVVTSIVRCAGGVLPVLSVKTKDDIPKGKIFEVLDGIEGPTLVCGVGGSAVVGTYLAKILREKKHIIATFIYPRDLYYMNVSGYENIVSVSYSGNNIGVDAIKGRKLNKYLLTGNPKKGFKNIVYKMQEIVFRHL